MPQLVDAGSNALAGFWELNKIKREKPYRDLQVQLGQQNLAESQQQMEARRKAMEEGDQFRKVMGFSQEELGVIARTMDKMTPENQVKFWNAKVKPYNGFELTIDPSTQRTFMSIKGQLVEIPREGEPKFYGEQSLTADERDQQEERKWLELPENKGRGHLDWIGEKAKRTRVDTSRSPYEDFAGNDPVARARAEEYLNKKSRQPAGAGRGMADARRKVPIEARKNSRLMSLEQEFKRGLMTPEELRNRKQQIQDAYEGELEAAGFTADHMEYPSSAAPASPSAQPTREQALEELKRRGVIK